MSSQAELDVTKIRERSDAYFAGLETCFLPRQIEVDRRNLLQEVDRLRRELAYRDAMDEREAHGEYDD